jgi:hypothetical protein
MDWRGWKLWDDPSFYSTSHDHSSPIDELIGAPLLRLHFLWDPFMSYSRVKSLQLLNPRVHVMGYYHWWNYHNATEILDSPGLQAAKTAVMNHRSNDYVVVYVTCPLAKNNEGHPRTSKSFIDKEGTDVNAAIQHRNKIVSELTNNINAFLKQPRFLILDLENIARAGRFSYVDRVHFTCSFDSLDTCVWFWTKKSSKMQPSLIVESPRCNCCPVPSLCRDPLHLNAVHFLLHLLRPFL